MKLTTRYSLNFPQKNDVLSELLLLYKVLWGSQRAASCSKIFIFFDFIIHKRLMCPLKKTNFYS